MQPRARAPPGGGIQGVAGDDLRVGGRPREQHPRPHGGGRTAPSRKRKPTLTAGVCEIRRQSPGPKRNTGTIGRVGAPLTAPPWPSPQAPPPWCGRRLRCTGIFVKGERNNLLKKNTSDEVFRDLKAERGNRCLRFERKGENGSTRIKFLKPMIPKLPKFLNRIRHNVHPENNPHRKNEVTGKRHREPVCLKQNILICRQIVKSFV